MLKEVKGTAHVLSPNFAISLNVGGGCFLYNIASLPEASNEDRLLLHT